MTESLAVHLPDESDAIVLRQEIYNELGQIIPHEVELDRGYIRLGALLFTFKKKEYWRQLNYPNFDGFLIELAENFKRGRTQLYSYLAVAENLLPSISENELDEMGIGKASELKRALAGDSTRELTSTLISLATNPLITVKELRAAIHSEFNIKDDPRPAGTWLDLGGFYATEEERKEFDEAIKIGVAVLNIKKETPDWIKVKEVLLYSLRDFASTYGPEVYGPGAEK
jgi:hypothetical protein